MHPGMGHFAGLMLLGPTQILAADVCRQLNLGICKEALSLQWRWPSYGESNCALQSIVWQITMQQAR